MATSQELFVQMKALFETVEAEQAKGNKASKGRARKAAGELKKLITPFRAASTAEGKQK